MKNEYAGYLPLNLHEHEGVKYNSFNWGPYVMATTLSNKILDRMKEDGEKLREEDNYNEHLAGQLNHQYQYKQETKEWFYHEITPVIQAYRKGHCKYHGLPDLGVDIGPVDLWINYMKAGDYNPYHVHGGAYSFVFFLDIPEELVTERKQYKGTHAAPGSLIFQYGQVQEPTWSRVEQIITPNTGDFLMFPALLHHSVCPFKSDVTRISISGNMHLLNRDKLPKTYF